MTSTLRRLGRSLENRLDPATSLVEIVAAIVIALGVVSSARLGLFGPPVPAETFAVVMACGLAWGVVDAGLYLLATKLENGRLDRVAADLRDGSELTADRRRAAVQTVYSTLDDAGPADLVEPAYAAVAGALAVPRPPRRLTRADFGAAGLVVGWVVVTSALLGLPLLLPVSTDVAHLGAQVWGVVLLFVAGTVWTRHTTYRPVTVGLGLAAIGATMIVFTLVLGAV